MSFSTRKWDNFLYEQLLIESRLKAAAKKFPEIDPDVKVLWGEKLDLKSPDKNHIGFYSMGTDCHNGSDVTCINVNTVTFEYTPVSTTTNNYEFTNIKKIEFTYSALHTDGTELL